MVGPMIAKWRLGKLIHGWLSYREMVASAFRDEVPPNPEQEASFLKLEARMATQLQHVADALPANIRRESAQHLEEMCDLLKWHTSLKNRSSDQPWNPKDFDRLWHRHFIFLNELKGITLDGSGANGVHPAKAGKAAARRAAGGRRFLGRLGRALLVIAVLAVVVYLVGSGLGVSRDATGRVTVAAPGSAGAVVENVLNAGQSLLAWATGFLGPVIATYGTTGAALLLGALVLALAYWFLLRG